MQKKHSRILAFFMAFVMLLSVTPWALGAPATGQVTLDAEGPVLTVVANDASVLDPFEGSTSTDFEFQIQRDYEQPVWIPLANNTSYNVPYYMTVDNAGDYPDLSMNFVAYRTYSGDTVGSQGGYDGNPGVLPGNNTDCGALLNIFAQEARGQSYDIQVTFHNLNADTTATKTINVTVEGYGMDLSETNTAKADGSLDVTLTNNGSSAITSMNVDLDDALAPYACFPTLIQNYSLGAGRTVTFTVATTTNLNPGETKSGNLLVTGNGETKQFPISLTCPAAPSTTSGEQLAEDISEFGRLTAASDSIAHNANSDGSITFSFNMESSKESIADIPVTAKISTTKVTENGSQPSVPTGTEVETLSDGRQFWVDGTTFVSGDKINIKLYQLIPVTNTASLSEEELQAALSEMADDESDTALDGESEETVNDGLDDAAVDESNNEAELQERNAALFSDGEAILFDDDAVTAILKEFDLEIDLSASGASDDLPDQYATAVENDKDLANLNNAPLPPKTKARAIAYRQMEILLELVMKYGTPEQQQALLDELNKDLPESAKKKSLDEWKQEFSKAVDVYMENAGLEREKSVIPYDPDSDDTPPNGDRGENDKDDWASIDINEDGSQCTNRGKITSSFHSTDTLGPGRSRVGLMDAVTMAADKGIRIFYTGRITSEDKYINFEPITYALSIKTSQGEQSIGTSVNTGLSEMNIIELDPRKIPMGEKISFTRDYDINPGTHFVTTDNRYSIVYPADAQVPDDATGVHLAVPDFDVYRKNIFLLDAEGGYIEEGIVGRNKLHVSVSNRGAKGGYYQMLIKDDTGKALIDDANDGKYRYLPAFTTKALELDINLGAVRQDITVTVTDCSRRTKETETGNNTATNTVSARNRAVPSITSIGPSNGTVLSSLRASLNAYLSNAQDVQDVTFTLTKSGETEPVYTDKFEEKRTYYRTDTVTLEPGSTYTLKVDVNYLKGGLTDAAVDMVSDMATFTTPSNSEWAGITLPAGSTIQSDDPEWTLYTVTGSGDSASYSRYKSSDYSSDSEAYDVVKKPDGSFALTLLGTDSALNGKVLVVYDPEGRALYAGTVGSQGSPVDMTARKKLVLDGAEFSTEYISVMEPNRSYRTVKTDSDGKTVQLPDIPVEVEVDLLVDGASCWTYQSLKPGSYDANGTYTITIGDYGSGSGHTFEKFTFTVDEGVFGSARYLYKAAAGASYISTYLNSAIDGTRMTLLLNKENLPVSVTDELLYLSIGNGSGEAAIYTLPVASYQKDMKLADLPTHTLSLTAQNTNLLQIRTIFVTPQDISLRTRAIKQIRFTPGEYTLEISYQYNGASYYATKNVDLKTEDRTIDLSDGIADLAQMSLSWDNALGSVTFNLTNTSNGETYQYSFDEDETNAEIRLPAGTYSTNAYCWSQDNGGYAFDLQNITLSVAAPVSRRLSAALTGTLKFQPPASGGTYNPNRSVQVTISDVKDAQGNIVTYCSGSISGYITFTPEDGSKPVVRQIRLPAQFDESNSVSVRLPGQPGSFTTSFSLASPIAGDYVITASSGTGGSISPSGNVQVQANGRVTFNVTPDEGYMIDRVVVDGADVGARSSYTFENVNANHSITASFLQTGDRQDELTDRQDELTDRKKRDKNKDSSNRTDDENSGKQNNPVQEQEPIEQRNNPFMDVTEGDWFYNDVLNVYEGRLFSGTSATAFSPNSAMSRAMFVTVLSRVENQRNGTAIQGSSTFTDILPGQWYSNSVAWAADRQITSGYGNGRFGRDDHVTREQACAFLMRYLIASGVDLSAYDGQVTFADALSISDWARESVGKAQQLGLVQGRGDNRFDPQASMTRAECASMFQRLMDVLK